MDPVLDDLRSFIAYRVLEGFESEAEIVENASNYACETHDRDDMGSAIRQLTAEALAAHLAEQVNWPTPTDCDRLDEAFAALERRRIVARQDFSCCTNCGHTDIWDEIVKELESQPIEGYVFYHFQCTERAIESGELLLAYGALDEGEEELTRVANAVVAELRRAGLDARWEGDPCCPIIVEGIVWRRRR
jgi:hypothetical protein